MTDRTRVDPTVAGIHGDHDVAVAVIGRVRGVHHPRARLCRRVARRLAETHNQPLTACARFPGSVRRHCAAQLDDHTQRTVRLQSKAQRRNHARGLR